MKFIKTLIILAAGLMLSGYSYDSVPVGYSKDAFWFCKFVGHNEQDVKILGLSRVFVSESETEYDDIEDDFEKSVYDQLGGNFVSDFPARCMDFESERLAKKHNNRQKKTAKDNGYAVVYIDFP